MLLECKNVSKSFKGQRIVKDMSFSLDDSEIVGLIGPNGAGKTTIMKLIAGLYKKDTGEIFIDSVDQSNFTEFAKNIGTIIETPMFPDNLSGLDTLKYYSKLRKVNADLEGLLKMTGVLSQKDKKVKHYSLGNKQKLGIAQALLAKPRLLILDEPFNGLDQEGITGLKEILTQQKKMGNTVLISSHTLPELQNICDKYIFIKNGSVIKEITREKMPQEKRAVISINIMQVKEVENIFSKYSYTVEFDGKYATYTIENISINEFIDLLSELRKLEIDILSLSEETLTLEDIYNEYFMGS